MYDAADGGDVGGGLKLLLPIASPHYRALSYPTNTAPTHFVSDHHLDTRLETGREVAAHET